MGAKTKTYSHCLFCVRRLRKRPRCCFSDAALYVTSIWTRFGLTSSLLSWRTDVAALRCAKQDGRRRPPDGERSVLFFPCFSKFGYSFSLFTPDCLFCTLQYLFMSVWLCLCSCSSSPSSFFNVHLFSYFIVFCLTSGFRFVSAPVLSCNSLFFSCLACCALLYPALCT